MNFSKTRLLLASALLWATIFSAEEVRADIVRFMLTGSAGSGLLSGNINPDPGEQGTGGIGATGITFNTANNLLHVDVEWGSANGYTDLSQDVMMLHLHGPTPGAGVDGFGQVGPMMVVLSNANGFNGSASSGGISANYFLDNTQATVLLENRAYINVHLSDTDTGRMRGYLMAVPEPGFVVPAVIALTAIAARRRRR